MPDAQDVNHGLPFAKLSSRILAAFLDLVACYLLTVVIMVPAVGLGGGSWIIPALFIVVPWLYFAGFEASPARATPGKKYYRIVVTDAEGRRISLARASLRFLGKAAILASMGLGLLICVFDRQRRGLDDYVAGTRVLDTETVALKNAWSLLRKAIPPLVIIAVLVLLGKVALDAQEKFRTRTDLSILLADARARLQPSYEAHYETYKRAPATADLPVINHRRARSVSVDANGNLIIQLNSPEGTLRLIPAFGADGAITWTCRAEASDLSAFPSVCRNQ